MPAGLLIPLITGVAGAAGSVVSGALSNRANNKSADSQLAASNHAADLEYKSSQEALAAAREQQDYERWLTSATSEARKPYLDALSSALGASSGGGYNPTNYQAPTYESAQPFNAPTMAQATNDPGYQFALAEGQKGLERSAAARGTLLTGGTLKDALNYNQQAGSQQYDKVYGRALNEYSLGESLRKNAFDTNAQNSFNAASLNNSSAYNAASLANQSYGQRLSALSALAGLASPGAYPGTRPTAGTGMAGPFTNTTNPYTSYDTPVEVDQPQVKGGGTDTSLGQFSSQNPWNQDNATNAPLLRTL